MAEKKSYTGNPGWLKWLVLAFIGYAVYMHFTGQTPSPSAPRESGKAGLPVSSPAAPEMPSITDSRITVGGDIKGTGDEAQCGQTAIVRASATLPDGKEYEGAAISKEPMEIRVGAPDKAYPWTAGLPGMSAGGVRELLVPASYVFDEAAMKEQGLAQADSMRFRVHLDSLTPTVDLSAIPLRVMDTVPARGPIANCGDTVEISLVLWKQDGTVLYDSGKTAPLSIALGGSSVFYGLDRAILGMREGGVRTAIIPPAYIVSSASHPAKEGLPEGQIAIADIVLSRVIKPQNK